MPIRCWSTSSSDLVLSAASVRSATCTCTFALSLGGPTRSGTPVLQPNRTHLAPSTQSEGTTEHLNTICESLCTPLFSLKADSTCGCSTGTQTASQPPTHLNLSPTISRHRQTALLFSFRPRSPLKFRLEPSSRRPPSVRLDLAPLCPELLSRPSWLRLPLAARSSTSSVYPSLVARLSARVLTQR